MAKTSTMALKSENINSKQNEPDIIVNLILNDGEE